MNDQQKLRVLLLHWLDHNVQHCAEYRKWIDKAGKASRALEETLTYSERINISLKNALSQIDPYSDKRVIV